ncbi:MAG: metallophosphoesterase [Ignavibacteria bacterium]|nr:metallophosphoesterase [Ignavibacteria bacterium]
MGSTFIITVGDNIYFGRNSISQNSCTPQHVNDYDSVVKKYSGNYYTKNINTNRFFPCIGDHDIAGEIDTDPRSFYLCLLQEYFSLPNNERYYTFLMGNIRFICLNNDFGGISTWTGGGYTDTTVWEPDGIDSSSVQAHWAKSILDTSTAKWHVIYQHKPVYFSYIATSLDIFKKVRWPFKRWGADIGF